MSNVVSIFGRKDGTKKPSSAEPYTYVLFNHFGGIKTLWRHKKENFPEFLDRDIETGKLSWNLSFGTVGYEYEKQVAESYAPVDKDALPAEYNNLPE